MSDVVIYHLQCAVMGYGCRSAIAIDGPRNIDVYDLDRQVPEGIRVADLLAASGWWLDHGQWVCGNHDQKERGASGHEPDCAGGHVAAISCADITRLRAEMEERNVLWSCPNSPSRSQTVHTFGNPKDVWTECLNGCGMTWARLQETTR